MIRKVIELTRKVGDQLIDHRQSGRIQIQTKADGSPVTDADKTADELLRRGLREIAPTIPVLSEETEAAPYESRKNWNEFWLVDPLDGTKAFCKGQDDFAVSVALIRGGIATLGVIYAPAKRVLYYGSAGSGSFKSTAGSDHIRIYAAKPRAPMTQLRIVESASKTPEAQEEFLKKLDVASRNKMSSAIKFGLLAEGKADLYVRFIPCMEWDVAAGDAIYKFSGLEGPLETPFKYNSPTLLNGTFLMGWPAQTPEVKSMLR